MKRAFVIALAFFCLHAHAITWICALPPQVRTADSARSTRSIVRIDRLDLVRAYSGQPVLMGGTWLLAVMLPASHPETRQAFGELGLSPEAAERMASGSSLIDRGIRVVQNPEQMVNKVVINPPAVGYAGFFIGGRDVAPCF